MDIKNNLECLELEFRVATDQDFFSDLGACNLHCVCKLEKNEYLFCMPLKGKPVN